VFTGQNVALMDMQHDGEKTLLANQPRCHITKVYASTTSAFGLGITLTFDL